MERGDKLEAFFYGFGSVMEIIPCFGEELEDVTDRDAVGSDWGVVGEDLWGAIEDVSEG